MPHPSAVSGTGLPEGTGAATDPLTDEGARILEEGNLLCAQTGLGTGMTVVSGSGLMPPLRRPQPSSHCETVWTALKVGSCKMVGQVLSAGAGELVASGVRIGFNALIVLPGGGGAIAAVVVGGTVVAVTGYFIGKRAAELLQGACGSSGCWTTRSLTLLPIVVPLATALSSGLTQGAVRAAARSLAETLCRRIASSVRDTFNEFGRGVLPDTRFVDGDGVDIEARDMKKRGALLQALPNMGVAVAGQFLFPVELDGATGYALPVDEWVRASPTAQFRSGLGGMAASAFVKGGFALGIEVGNGLSASLSGGGLRQVEGKGLEALSENLRDPRSTWGRVKDHSAMRMFMQTFSGDMIGPLPKSPGALIGASVLQAAGESRGYVVSAGRQPPPERPKLIVEEVEFGDLREIAAEDFNALPSLERREAPTAGTESEFLEDKGQTAVIVHEALSEGQTEDDGQSQQLPVVSEEPPPI